MSGRKPYSDDLRALVVDQVEGGMSRREAGRHVRVSAATAVRWAQHKARTGQSGRTAKARASRSPLEAHAAWLLALVEAEPDLTLEQIVERAGLDLGVGTTTSSVDRFFARHRISFKINSARRRTGAARRGPGESDLEGQPAKS